MRLKKVRLANSNEQSGLRRREALNVRRALGDGLLTEQGFPKPCMPFRGASILTFGEEDKKTILVAPCPHVKTSCPDIDAMQVVCCITFTGNDEFKGVFALKDAFGSKRLETVITRVKEGVTSDELLSSIRFKKKGAVADDYATAWVPAFMIAIGGAKFIDDWASPFMFGSGKFGVRYYVDRYPFQGFGHYMKGVEGRRLVLAWSMDSTIEAGGAVAEALDMLGRISVNKAKEFFSKKVSWSVVEVTGGDRVSF